jgi:hypothetical protein
LARKRPKNLLLDGDALEHGETYARLSGTTLSRLVEDYLVSLPTVWNKRYQIRTEVVRELYAAARVSPEDAKQQAEFLEKWRSQREKP